MRGPSRQTALGRRVSTGAASSAGFGDDGDDGGDGDEAGAGAGASTIGTDEVSGGGINSNSPRSDAIASSAFAKRATGSFSSRRSTKVSSASGISPSMHASRGFTGSVPT